MNFTRIALGILVTALSVGTTWAQEMSAPAATTPATQAEPASHPMRIRVAGNVQQANIVHLVQPVYPADARRAHISASVMLHLIVGTDGAVQAVDVVSGPQMLRQAATDAAKQWKYRPTLVSGEPVEAACFAPKTAGVVLPHSTCTEADGSRGAKHRRRAQQAAPLRNPRPKGGWV